MSNTQSVTLEFGISDKEMQRLSSRLRSLQAKMLKDDGIVAYNRHEKAAVQYAADLTREVSQNL